MFSTPKRREPLDLGLADGQWTASGRLRPSGTPVAPSLLSGTIEGSHRAGDVLDQARGRPTVRGGERIVASLRRRLAYGRAADPQLTVFDASHRPDRVERRRLAQGRSEALHLDGGLIVG